MIEKFNQIIKETVHPLLKSNGFKKKGLNFVKPNNEVQQIINFQKSGGNASNKITFYINCGILLNDFIEKKRDLKTVWDCDIQKRIRDISPLFIEDGIIINEKTNSKALSEQLTNALNQDILPYFEKNNTTELCVLEMVNNNGLHKNKELLNFLCQTKNNTLVKRYIQNIKTKLMESDGIERTKMFMTRFEQLLTENQYLTPEIETLLKQQIITSC